MFENLNELKGTNKGKLENFRIKREESFSYFKGCVVIEIDVSCCKPSTEDFNGFYIASFLYFGNKSQFKGGVNSMCKLQDFT